MKTILIAIATVLMFASCKKTSEDNSCPVATKVRYINQCPTGCASTVYVDYKFSDGSTTTKYYTVSEWSSKNKSEGDHVCNY